MEQLALLLSQEKLRIRYTDSEIDRLLRPSWDFEASDDKWVGRLRSRYRNLLDEYTTRRRVADTNEWLVVRSMLDWWERVPDAEGHLAPGRKPWIQRKPKKFPGNVGRRFSDEETSQPALNSLLANGDYREVLLRADHAIICQTPSLRQKRERLVRAAQLLQAVGGVAYYSSRTSTAYKLSQQALSLYEAADAVSAHQTEVIGLTNRLANLDARQRETGRARCWIGESEELADRRMRSNSPLTWGHILLNSALVSTVGGDYHRTSALLDLAESVFEEASDVNGRGLALLNRGLLSELSAGVCVQNSLMKDCIYHLARARSTHLIAGEFLRDIPTAIPRTHIRNGLVAACEALLDFERNCGNSDNTSNPLSANGKQALDECLGSLSSAWTHVKRQGDERRQRKIEEMIDAMADALLLRESISNIILYLIRANTMKR